MEDHPPRRARPRRRPERRALILAAAALSVASLAGEAEAQDRAHLFAANDNDFWVLRGEDRGYSNGLEAGMLFPARPLAGAERALLSGSIGQAMFTPSDLRETSPEALRRDHPYIGWLWATAGLEQFFSRARLALEARAGAVGPHAFGREAQIAWHSWNRAPRPRGWQVLEVGDEADLAARAALSVEAPRAEIVRAGEGTIGLLLTADASCEVGTLRVLCQGGPWVRVGLLRPGAAQTPTLAAPVAPLFADGSGRRPVELFAFAALTARYSWRDQVLEGDVCDGEGRCEEGWVSRAPLVSERWAGVGGAIGGWSLSFAYVRRSPELEAPASLARPKHFGRLTLGTSW